MVATQFPAYGAYTASEGAVEAITLILARELRGRDITVNAVAPGPTATGLFLDGKTDEQIKALTKAPPLERLGTPADIAHVVAFLTSREGHWVNGQILRRTAAWPDGGVRPTPQVVVITGASNGFGRLAAPLTGTGRPHRRRRDARHHRSQRRHRRTTRPTGSRRGSRGNFILVIRSVP